MKPPLQFRRANLASLDSFLPLFRAYQAHYQMLTRAGEEQTRTFLSQLVAQPETGFVILASVGEDLVGFATGYFTISGVMAERMVHLGDLYVVPAHRRQGIATSLVRQVAERARDCGIGLVRWLSLATNTELNPWYESLGATSGDFKLFLLATGPSDSASGSAT